METGEKTRYIYLGNNINLPEFRFTKGGVYFGEKIEELIKKYPLLGKLLIDTEKLPEFDANETLLEKLTDELNEEIKGGSK